MYVYIGKAITAAQDALQKVPLDILIQGIRNPKPEMQDRIKQLRIAQTVDPNRYKELKKQLVYFTCGSFYPLIRRKENFASIDLFVIDLDHLRQADINIENLSVSLKQDPRIAAFFVSPGGDGLKVLFLLQDSCRDSALFSSFYKVFALKFAQEFHLENVTDYKTSDVSRACFVSHDPEAYFNPEPEKIDLNLYLNPLDFDISERTIKRANDTISDIVALLPKPENNTLTNDVLAQIKQKLSPNALQARPKKQYFVPEQLNELMPLLYEHVVQYGILIEKEEPISYGKRLRFKVNLLWAELNVFYGKKGYTVVKTLKTGCNAELVDLCYTIVNERINC
jgi:hypothetical protein